MPAAADQLAGLTAAASQVWPAFALVAGLLLVGVVAERDGLFAAAGAGLARLPTGPRTTFVLALCLVALVTAVLNLDTSVFFLTPVLLHLARARGSNEVPYLYGVVFMSNASSLFLPGANLTNLIVLHHEQVSGATFLSRMWAAAIAAAAVTAALLVFAFRRELREARHDPKVEPATPRVGLGAAAVAVSTVLVLALTSPALPVLVVGLITVALSRVPRARLLAAIDVRTITGLFAFAVALGTLGRAWRGPEALVDSLDSWQTAAAGALTAIAVNNLPAAVLLTPDPPAHPRALLLGLNLGPNLAVTGGLAALLWFRVARSLGARPSLRRYSQLGLLIAPLSLGAAVAALWLVAPGRL
ncbi:MAG: Arsenic efflux pump protein [Actinomycetia bacterium]|nr:Arsenic efflux pump protein [Actinomycetes bacterium]